MYTNVTKCIGIRWLIREISIRGESLFSRAKHLVSVNLVEFVFPTHSVRFRQRIKSRAYEILYKFNEKPFYKNHPLPGIWKFNKSNPLCCRLQHEVVTLVYIKNHWFCKIDLLKLLSSKEAKLSLRKFANSVRRTRLVTGWNYNDET